MNRGTRLLGIAFLGCAVCAAQTPPPAPPPVKVSTDGSVEVPAHTVPMTGFLSPEGRAYVTKHLHDVQRPEMLAQKDGIPVMLAGYLERQRALFPVERRDVTIGGVHAFEYLPKEGVSAANRNRVLINLHGGGFTGCWPACAELESIPVAALGRIRVVSLDYRQSPQFKHPAASEDVASAYRELLKTHSPENIGLYGCSAGGMLTGMSVAWFQKHGLPRPGAVGVLCSGMTLEAVGFGGDAAYTSAAIGESRPPPWPPTGMANGRGYFEGVSPTDPLVAPASSPEVLKQFPPTLIVTGTRSFDQSSAVYTHSLLVKHGVETDLHVWEGMFHGFFYNVDVPESRDCYDVIVKFFDRHLGNRQGTQR